MENVTNNNIDLPYHEASFIVNENCLLDPFVYKSRMTIAGIVKFIPNPMNKKLCATVAYNYND